MQTVGTLEHNGGQEEPLHAYELSPIPSSNGRREMAWDGGRLSVSWRHIILFRKSVSEELFDLHVLIFSIFEGVKVERA